MCVICVEYEKGKLTGQEAKAALDEMILTEDMTLEHAYEVSKKIEDTEKAKNA